MKSVARSAAWLVFFLSLAPARAFAQGSLTPPGAPGPAMKSLDQIASIGIAINDTNTPGNASAVYVLSAPGSYFLTGNLLAPQNKNGIIIDADNVTIELNGFAIISGTSGQSALSGIAESAVHKNIAIQNGTVRGWGLGDITLVSTNIELRHLRLSDCQGTAGQDSNSGDGINARLATDVLIVDSVATNNAGDGFAVQGSGAVMNCFSSHNMLSGYSGINVVFNNCAADSNGSAGFFIFSGCHLAHCTATNSVKGNQSGGFFLGIGSSANDCVAYGNKGAGFSDSGACNYSNCVGTVNAEGMSTGPGSIVTNCNMYQSINGGIGFAFGNDCLITNNSAAGNGGIGFEFGSNCLLTNNSAADNGGAGFKSNGSLNRIDSNTAVKNGGFGFIWGNDYLVRNLSQGNTAGTYSPMPGGSSPGNSGPVQAAFNADNAWANF